MIQQNNPNLHFEMRDNPIWSIGSYDNVSEDDEAPKVEDPTCSTVLLTAQEKNDA